MNKVTLALKGTYWKNLSEPERQELLNQFPRLHSDPNHKRYRYLKSRHFGWIIMNAMNLPLETKSMDVTHG